MYHYRKFILLMIFHCLIKYSFGDVTLDTCQEDVVGFVNVLKDSINKNVNPCTDFASYACGHLNNSDATKFIDIDFYLKNILDGNPKNKVEENIQDYHKNCLNSEERKLSLKHIHDIFEEIDTLKSYGSFPITGHINFNSSEVGKMEAILNGFGQSAIFSATPEPNRHTIIFAYYSARWPPQNISQYIYNKDLQTEKIEIEEELTKVENYFRDLQELASKAYDDSNTDDSNTDDFYEMKSLDELDNLASSKNFDFSTYRKVFQNELKLISMNDGKYKFDFAKFSHSKDFIKFLDSVDIKTLINAQIFSYLHGLARINCQFTNFLGRVAALKEAWKDILSSEIVTKRYTNFLNNFETNFKTTAASEPEKSVQSIQKILNRKREVLSSYDSIITDEILAEYQEGFESGKYYKNFVSFVKKMMQIILENDETDVIYELLLTRKHEDAIDLNIKNKPYLYYYSVVNFKLWFEYYQLENSISNQTKECFKKVFDENNEEKYDDRILSSYTAIKSILATYSLEDLLKDELHNCKQFKVPEIFFISIAQNLCHEYSYKKPNEIPLMHSFKYLEEFSKAFRCPDHSKMNQYSKVDCN